MTRRQPTTFRDSTVSAGGLRVHVTRYAAGAVQRPHEHASGATTLIYRGGLVERVGGREEWARPLSVVVKPPGVRHANRFGPEGASALQVSFETTEPGAWKADWGLGPWRWIHDGVAAKPFLAILAELRASGSDDVLESLLYDLGATLAPLSDRDRPRGAGAGPPPRWLARARARLLEDPAEPLRVRDLAREAGVHPVSLARAFRRHYGAPVTAYVRRRRVALAAARLSGTEQPLCDVALGTGFADQPHFCRSFKNATGLTPLRYRRLARA